jgi:hypothetical protein
LQGDYYPPVATTKYLARVTGKRHSTISAYLGNKRRGFMAAAAMLVRDIPDFSDRDVEAVAKRRKVSPTKLKTYMKRE